MRPFAQHAQDRPVRMSNVERAAVAFVVLLIAAAVVLIVVGSLS